MAAINVLEFLCFDKLFKCKKNLQMLIPYYSFFHLFNIIYYSYFKLFLSKSEGVEYEGWFKGNILEMLIFKVNKQKNLIIPEKLI